MVWGETLLCVPRFCLVSVFVIAGLHLRRQVEAAILDVAGLVLTQHALGGALDLLLRKNEPLMSGFRSPPAMKMCEIVGGDGRRRPEWLMGG